MIYEISYVIDLDLVEKDARYRYINLDTIHEWIIVFIFTTTTDENASFLLIHRLMTSRVYLIIYLFIYFYFQDHLKRCKLAASIFVLFSDLSSTLAFPIFKETHMRISLRVYTLPKIRRHPILGKKSRLRPPALLFLKCSGGRPKSQIHIKVDKCTIAKLFSTTRIPSPDDWLTDNDLPRTINTKI